MFYYVPMKTAKSTTENASEEFELEKIRRFTESELAKLSHSDLPFCYQIGTDVLVGKSRVIKIDTDCWRVFVQGQQIFDFFHRKDAIFYCIAVHQKQNAVANEIIKNDQALSTLEFEAALYRHRYRRASEISDTWAREYYSNKYNEVTLRINYTKKELKKNFDLAKYTKL